MFFVVSVLSQDSLNPCVAGVDCVNRGGCSRASGFFFGGDGLFRPQRVELGVLVTWKVL
jgi:hypothetical protein